MSSGTGPAWSTNDFYISAVDAPASMSFVSGGVRHTPEEYAAMKEKPPIPELGELKAGLEQGGAERVSMWLEPPQKKAVAEAPGAPPQSVRDLFRRQQILDSHYRYVATMTPGEWSYATATATTNPGISNNT